MVVPRRARVAPLPMTIGMSLFLIAIGAVLKFAVTDSISGIDLETVGVILMIVGIVGLLISLLYMSLWAERSRGTATRERYVERDRGL